MTANRWKSTRMTLGALAAALFPRPLFVTSAAGSLAAQPALAYAEKRRLRARPGLRGHKYRI